uniref:Uncharacterized protein n=1 Tax=Medicago truncatula TaxID=3880 RepID=A2Q1D1_MEDTR|nr:hypothetical protein MtrDRAFT_AC148775g38v2 [Medicago truncatula]
MDSVMRIGHWSGLEQHPQVVGSFLEIACVTTFCGALNYDGTVERHPNVS